jgi:predicted metal-dependent hydrolase
MLTARPDSGVDKRSEVMQEWYRDELTKVLEDLIEKWQKKIGVKLSFWGTRRMKTKWGSCNEKDKRVLFNLELAKKPKSCIEYVVVHELVHLIERKHNDKFIDLMDKFLPKWRSERDELNQLILAYEEWDH